MLIMMFGVSWSAMQYHKTVISLYVYVIKAVSLSLFNGWWHPPAGGTLCSPYQHWQQKLFNRGKQPIALKPWCCYHVQLTIIGCSQASVIFQNKISTHTGTHQHTHTHKTHTVRHTRTHTQTHTQIRTRTRTNRRTRTNPHTRTNTSTKTQTHTQTHTQMHTQTQTQKRMQTQTQTQTQAQT